MKKGRYHDGVQIFTYQVSICLTSKVSNKNLADGNFDQKMCFKDNLMLQFPSLEDFAWEKFPGGEHLTSASTKTA